MTNRTWQLKWEVGRLEGIVQTLQRDKALLLDAISHASRHNKKLIRDRLRDKKAPQELFKP